MITESQMQEIRAAGYEIHPVGRPLQFLVARVVGRGKKTERSRSVGVFPTFEAAVAAGTALAASKPQTK
jgi:hypothetical protein